ncbi:MAG TPA: AI-2E family transporter, partial [Gaiellaceae bacterium]|nr:AI-2E family transporter [Gaiellaceae bacterium]
MEPGAAQRVEVLLPVRTVIVALAALGLAVALGAIGDTFLIVFVGIFLALVFEYPVRFVMAKTHMSRGLAATVTVIGTALAVTLLMLVLLVPLAGSVRDFLQELPQTVESLRESDELSWLGDSGGAQNVQDGAEQVSVSI